jgi:hypothetical protein
MITIWQLGYSHRHDGDQITELDGKGDYVKLKALVDIILTYSQPVNLDTSNRTFIVTAELWKELTRLKESF